MILRGLRAGLLSARLTRGQRAPTQHQVAAPSGLLSFRGGGSSSPWSSTPARASPEISLRATTGMSAAEVKPGNEVEVTEVQQEEQKLPVHDPATKFRKDYKPTPFSVESVNLNFILNEDVTHVHSILSLKPNYQGPTPPPLKLDGRKDLKLVSLKVNGADVNPSEYNVTEKDLTLAKLPPGPVTLNIVTEIKPQENSSLEGLYKSSGNFCTQCEAEGFRGITYFLDRPDVMATYQVRVEADKANYPVLLSNGNLKSQGDLEGGRHFALWEDPFPKPCYLFALVAGKLSMKERMFKTMSGKDVALRIFVQENNLGKVDHALESLVKAMKWDEETFGLEYDLNLFNIVAVDDFNMGAMENKSLNVFNSRLVLASPETATDLDYSRIEGVVGHEYFHNYTGNRVTCRDWFQLTLKEGLTVFRDQEFTSDLNSRPVKRIEDVMGLRVAQFPEDAGPMAHPIRPDSYIKMDNFYTMTVYEKGAEVVRLYNTLLGKEGFRKGMDLYFKRHDGHAVTCDDFLAAMADANNVDLSQLGKWYGQAGTPRLNVSTQYDAASQRYTLRMKQHTPPTPGQPNKEPLLIPVAVGLVGPDGKDLPLHLRAAPETNGTANGNTAQPTTVVLRLTEAEQEFVFEHVPAEPVPSILRGFSAPVRMTVEGQTDEHLQFLLANDSDEFNRWEAGQRLSRKLLLQLYDAASAAKVSSTDKEALQSTLADAGGVPDSLVNAFRAVLMEKGLDGSFKAMATTLPSGTELVDEIPEADPTLIYEVRSYVLRELAARMRPDLEAILKETDSAPGDAYVFNAKECARRTLKQKAINMLSTLEEPSIVDMILQRFREATNMTDQVGALGALVEVPCEARNTALSEFFEKWKSEPLVILKWLGLQAMSNAPGNLALVRSLVDHPAFNINNPNNCYSLFLAFARSPVNFHAADGSGYAFMGDSVLRVDKINHQVAARMVSAFTQFRQYDKQRQGLMRAQLERIVATNGLSENVFEICTKSLAA
uniref:Aminopeptidase N n=2 Tax=Dunaliella tertiolecta TaxID=3047 RepID=A0A7S3VSY4_DUNTE|mmetsp:Transcript_25641/g.69586  ORF Transcript_25641/g.69586 Transcript_25641/m.69586 type:complete len:996 (-) Transcript_25641:411-3398(-)|eukprot:CAMPEP_0202349430 /NCGR_PEP_ID=MMETSP1126-20121109/6930_1 /ASSEMBLY_ACC=CAM_ASM_000457 /TAXON_ID=3047 /ORGANISM="Dunaliella tertiolecta, Strain CCMP1320" /LENGTH=995 /DNA_ID=CAMNT_0048941249 /DNA_START=27 /DNA_END=3014 /DNA_ORIENTATION=+